MSIVQQSVSVEQATYQAGLLLAKFASDVKTALKSSSSAAEIIAIATAAVTDLSPILASIPAIKSEATESLDAEINTAFLVGKAVVQSIIS